MIRSYNFNELGRDYICSDIHGQFHILEQELFRMGFSEPTDRLFCLGDLIDRGDESALALEWLSKPWFHAIQGNHERMLINAFESQSETLWFQWMMWGGSWAEDMTYNDLEPFYRAFSSLQIAIELALPDGKKVGLVHAELPDRCDWKETKEMLLHLQPSQVEATLAVSSMLWGSYRSPAASEIQPVQGIDHVFHGHTIVESYQTIANRTFLDLGSYKTGKIGLIEPVDFMHSLSV